MVMRNGNRPVSAGLLDSLSSIDPESGELPGWVYSDQDLYALETEQIFNRCWVFLAHQSEIPSPGDFVTRELGDDSVIVARGADGAVRVMLNACRHRGTRLCRADSGSSPRFRCPYHGWTFRNDGALVAVPYQNLIFDESFDKADYPLVSARCDEYHGLIFGTWDEKAPPLRDYLGDMTWYVDLWAHRGPMEVIGPPQRWEVDIDWKIPSENFMSDAYHTSSAHGFSAKVGLVKSLDFARFGYQIYAGNGHGLTLGMPAPQSVFPDEIAAPYRDYLDEGQLSIVHQLANMPGTVFPNLSFLTSAFPFDGQISAFTSMRLFHPLASGRMRVYSWVLVERDAPAWWKERCHRAFLLTFGTSGTFEQDDMEIWGQVTRTARSTHGRQLSHLLEMGRGQAPVEFVGPGAAYDGKFSEHNSRRYYRRWRSLLLGGPVGEEETGRIDADHEAASIGIR